MNHIRLFLSVALLCRVASGGLIVLEKKFISEAKYRATIQFRFEIDHAKGTVNAIKSGGDDGDLHMAGRPLEKVGLPMVAEIVNAKQFTDAVKYARDTAQDEGVVTLTGVWRLWAEHPGTKPQKQNSQKPVPKPENTNPDHVFEIHPITRIDNFPLEPSFVPIAYGDKKYQPYGENAFASYARLTCILKADASTITIDTKKAGFNYVGFTAQLLGAPGALKDGGLMVIADLVAGSGDEATLYRKRLIFAPGTPPHNLLKTKKKGDALEILAIPRISLIDLDGLAAKPANLGRELPLPFEFIVVAAQAAE